MKLGKFGYCQLNEGSIAVWSNYRFEYQFELQLKYKREFIRDAFDIHLYHNTHFHSGLFLEINLPKFFWGEIAVRNMNHSRDEN